MKPAVHATAAVMKYAADKLPTNLMPLTVQESAEPSHSLSVSHLKDRHKAMSWIAKARLMKAPRSEMIRDGVLLEGGIVGGQIKAQRKERLGQGLIDIPRGHGKVVVSAVMYNRFMVRRKTCTKTVVTVLTGAAAGGHPYADMYDETSADEWPLGTHVTRRGLILGLYGMHSDVRIFLRTAISADSRW